MCIFHPTKDAISFAAQVTVVFCLFVQLEGNVERKLQGCINTSGQNKSFSQRHSLTCLPVNDTSFSYSSLNDLVCVALMVVRQTAGGSLEMSTVIVWKCRQAHRDEDKEGWGESKLVSFSTCCTHWGGRHCGTLHLINQTLIRHDLGLHYKPALNIRGKTLNMHTVITCERSSYSPINNFLRELKFVLEGRLIWCKDMQAKSRLVEFNEFCLSAGESARTTLITLYNELRSGEHHRKTKALSSPATITRQNKRAAYTHLQVHMSR